MTVLLRIVIAVVVSACESGGSESKPDGGSCPAGQVPAYVVPGCGSSAHPTCVDVIGDACASIACSCDGRTIYGGCGNLGEPFRSLGACADAARN